MVRGALIAAVTLASLEAAPPTFYRDVLPILQRHCQECHRPGEIAPMPLVSYQDARPWAKAIRDAVRARKMPPWFADPCCGRFANDRSLTPGEINTLANWAETNAVEGDKRDAPQPARWTTGWNIDPPDAIFQIPSFPVPPAGAIEYQYFAVPTHFTEDKWVQAVEVRPGADKAVHHAVVYIREPGSTWTGGPTKADILQVYAPGTAPEVWPPGTAKLIPAGSDLVFEIHYTPDGKPERDQTSVGLIFAKSRPAKRVLTLQMDRSDFRIPPGDPACRVTVSGTLPNDALLLGMFPHMHLRGKAFEFLRILPGGAPDVMLRVSNYNFYWQLDYRLAKPLPLKKGTRLVWTAWFDNSKNNPLNPDPASEVHYGHQSWDEMMVGFFDVAVEAGIDKQQFFVR